jgi:DNA modification methylase
MSYTIIQGDNRKTLKTIPDASIDAIVTDPPYGIDFLGKSWDANTGALETYQECLRVLKPGGHILAFSAARTYHHLAVTLEQAGFEIRDQIMWIYSSGFPKSQDVGRQIQKSIYGKPDKQRFDPAIMIKVDGDKYQHPDSDKVYRKLPDINGDRLKKSHEGQGYGCVFEEVMDIKYDKIVDTTKNAGFGQTDHARVRAGEEWSTQAKEVGQVKVIDPKAQQWSGWGTQLKPAHEPIALARKPIKLSIARNCQVHGVGALNIDATRVPYESQADKNAIDHKVPTAAWSGHTIQVDSYEKGEFVKVETNELGRFPSNVIGEIPDYQKYFYCPKVSRKERHIGHEMPPAMFGDVEGAYGPDGNRMAVGLDARTGNVGNNHPTVKPIELMKYLIKLITPPGGTVLDPFNGSGSTGCAAVELGFNYIGCELDPAYVEIANKRIEAWLQQSDPNNKLVATGLFNVQQ